RAIDASLPHRRTPAKLGEENPAQPHRMRVVSITMQQYDDLGEWYLRLQDDQRAYLRSDDKVLAPVGPGHVVTLRGRHFHDEPGDPRLRYLSYVERTLLLNLKRWTIPQLDVQRLVPTGALIPVRQLGISHPTISSAEPTRRVVLHKNGSVIDADDSPPSRGAPGAAQGQEVPMTEFTIQFAWKNIPRVDREAADPHEKDVARELTPPDAPAPKQAA